MKMGIFDFLSRWPDVEKLEANKDVKGLIKALDYKKDYNVRRRAVEALGKIGDPKAVDPLINALKDEDEYVRKNAAGALGKIGDPKAVDPLINALKDDDIGVRWRVVEALGKLGDPKAVDPLTNALKDENKYMRQGAAEALGKIGDPKAVDALINALKDEEWFMRHRAAEALGKIGWKPKDNEEKAWYLVANRDYESLKLGKHSVDPLINALKDEDENVRKWAVGALGKIGDPKAVDPLINALNDDVNSVRKWAAEALREIGDVRAVEPLIQAISSRELVENVRVSIAEALGMLHRKGCNIPIEKFQILDYINYKIEYSSHKDVSSSSDCPSHDDYGYGEARKVKSIVLKEDEMEW
jgi:HEAT repeat protein